VLVDAQPIGNRVAQVKPMPGSWQAVRVICTFPLEICFLLCYLAQASMNRSTALSHSAIVVPASPATMNILRPPCRWPTLQPPRPRLLATDTTTLQGRRRGDRGEETWDLQAYDGAEDEQHPSPSFRTSWTRPPTFPEVSIIHPFGVRLTHQLSLVETVCWKLMDFTPCKHPLARQ
jgi:hypothetical protein